MTEPGKFVLKPVKYKQLYSGGSNTEQVRYSDGP